MYKRTIAVLAGTFSEATKYRDNDAVKYVYCNNWPDFAGLKFDSLVEVGTFRKRKDALEIYQRVLPMLIRHANL